MRRVTLIFIVTASLIWVVFAGNKLLENRVSSLTPENFFCIGDSSVLLIQRLNEIENTPVLQQFQNNSLRSSVMITDWNHLDGVEALFLSKNYAKVLVKLNRKWKKRDIDVIRSYFSQNNILIYSDGYYLSIQLEQEACTNNDLSSGIFDDLDKKASANLWRFHPTNETNRTDIYALPSGFTQYKSKSTQKNVGKSVNDRELFSTVLPNTIEKYKFQERFLAADQDSVFANSIMFNWVNQGFVIATFQGEPFIVSDYQPQQLPSLILLEKSDLEDSIRITDEIKSFTGFQLTADFPTKKNGRIYTVEIEDLSIFTESRELAENLQLNYNLGETLALNNEKKELFFSGLPSTSHLREIHNNEKRAITWRSGLQFEVTAEPPISTQSTQSTTNWTYNSGFDKIKGATPIKDHIRGNTSVFIYDNKGNYKLINHLGKLVWAGSIDGTILATPQTIDLFENDKFQLLFSSENEIHIIDLNGASVGNFPFTSEHAITSHIHPFRWNNMQRFLFGNEKGELTVLSNKGQELNVVQAGAKPITAEPIAMNIAGNLRAWSINTKNETLLSYLERPIQAERKGIMHADKFIRQGGSVIGFLNKDDEVYRIDGNQTSEQQFFGKGQLVEIAPNYLITKNANKLNTLNLEGEIIHQLTLPFNEVGIVYKLDYKTRSIYLVHDYLENNVYAYAENGTLLTGFPKEARSWITANIDEEHECFQIITTIQKSIVNYGVKIPEELNVIPEDQNTP